MLYSTERILTTHAGSLPRPADLREMVVAKANGDPFDPAALDRRLRSAVAEVVRQQIACGLDCVNDGELSKTNFTDYVRVADRRLCRAAFRWPATAQHHGSRRDKIRRLFRGQSARTTGRSADDAGLCREIALCRAGRSRSRHRQSQSGARRGQRRRGVFVRQHPGHNRALACERILQER